MPLLPDQISIANVRPAYDASISMGVSVDALTEWGLPEDVMRNPDGCVSGEATYRHFEQMVERSDYATFVQGAVERHTYGTLGIVGLACKTLATVSEALACHDRFQHLTNQTARYHTTLEGPHLVLREERWGAPSEGLQRVSEYSALVALQLLRVGIDQPVRATALHVRSTTMSSELRDYFESFLGADVHVGSRQTSLVLDSAVLNHTVSSADSELAAFFQDRLHALAHFEPSEPALFQRVRRAIQHALATGRPTAARVARTLGMSPRTLHRHLKDHRATFGSLLETTRQCLAEDYLADPDLTLAEVAYLCGYVEQTSFFRAFRTWTGVTPSQRRTALLERGQP